jgi:hypothetical protein
MERRRIGALDLWLRLLAWAFIPLVMLAWLQSKGILRFGAPRVTQPHACENFYELHVIIIFTIVFHVKIRVLFTAGLKIFLCTKI